MKAAERGVPAQTGDFFFFFFYLRALVKGHLRIKNNKERWKYCQFLGGFFMCFLLVERSPKRTEEVL